MKFMLVSFVALSVLVLLVAAMACGDDGTDNIGTPTRVPKDSTPSAAESKNPTGGQTSSIGFPQHDAPLETDRGGQYFAGQIVISKGCLRAEAPTRNATNPRDSWLLIWPGSFSLEAESGSVRIIDGHGRVSARVGDHVRLSRAAVTHQQAMEQGLLDGLPEECGEPYLLVGDEATAFDPENEATELRITDPDVLFPRQETIMGFPTLMQALGMGELVLNGECLSLGDSTPIIWPAGFTPHSDGGVVQVRNGAGRVIATVGDEIAAGGGYHRLDSGACPGEVFFANSIKVLPDVEVYFPRQDGTLATGQGTERFAGELALDGKCLMVNSPLRVRDRVYLPVPPLLIWPSAFSLGEEDSEVGIVDGSGRVVARIGDEVLFSAFNLSYQQAVEHGGLEEITPACSGPYWAVGEDFTAGSFSASCAGLETVPDRAGLVSEREADELARKRLAVPSPSVTGMKVERTIGACLSLLRSYERDLMGRGPRSNSEVPPSADTPVWVVEVKGISQPAGLSAANADRPYRYGLVVLDARNGDTIESLRYWEPKLASLRQD